MFPLQVLNVSKLMILCRGYILECSVPRDMLLMARSFIENSYSPYSKFRVVSVVRAGSGKLYPGVNVENSSYGLTICAERVAVFNAVLNGERSILEVLVASDKILPYPCGACLQVVSEFGSDDTLFYIVALETGEYRCFRLKDLLPYRFKLYE